MRKRQESVERTIRRPIDPSKWVPIADYHAMQRKVSLLRVEIHGLESCLKDTMAELKKCRRERDDLAATFGKCRLERDDLAVTLEQCRLERDDLAATLGTARAKAQEVAEMVTQQFQGGPKTSLSEMATIFQIAADCYRLAEIVGK